MIIAEKWTQRIIAWTLIILPLVFIPHTKIFLDDWSDYYNIARFLGLIVLTGILLFVYLKNPQFIMNHIRKDVLNILLGLYCVYILISVIFALDIDLALNGLDFRKDGFTTQLMFFTLYLAARTIHRIDRKILIGTLIAGSIVAFYATLEYFGFELFNPYKPEGYFIISTMGNPNFLGTYLVLMLPLSLYFFIQEKQNWALLGFGFIFFSLLATMTRSAWLGSSVVAFGFLIYFFRALRTDRKVLIRFLILIAVAGAVTILYFILEGSEFTSRFFSIFADAQAIVGGQTTSENAGSNRGFIWPRVIELIKLKPWFGYGPENMLHPFTIKYFKEALAVYGYPVLVDKAHNEYLHIAINSGIPALLLYITFIIMNLKQGIKNLKSDPIFLIFLTAIIGYLVQAFFNISTTANAYVFWIFLGLLSSYDQKKIEEKVS